MPWERVVISGAGGHAREVAEILLHQARDGRGPGVQGFVVDDPENHGAEVGRLPVLGDWSWFDGADLRGRAVVCAVGLPQARSGRARAWRATSRSARAVTSASVRASSSG